MKDKTKRAILGIFFPRNIQCVFCNKDLFPHEKFVCDFCKQKLPNITNKVCQMCGEEIYDLSSVCLRCKTSRLQYLDMERARFKYVGKIKSYIVRFKFDNCKWLRDYFSYEIFEAFKEYYSNTKIDCIVPVPLHPKREKERGYNQAVLLLDKFEECGYKLELNNLIKQKQTSLQVSLNKEQRMKNLDGCFTVVDISKIKDKNVLLVDDVFTTGSTMEECARTLKRAGAKCVFGLTLAKTKNKIKMEQD